MKNVLIYNDFIGSVDFNADDEVFFGKVEGIDDLVSFEGSSVSELKAAFESSVDDYIEFCKKNNKQLEKSYKGSFNVKMPQEIHIVPPRAPCARSSPPAPSILPRTASLPAH